MRSIGLITAAVAAMAAPAIAQQSPVPCDVDKLTPSPIFRGQNALTNAMNAAADDLKKNHLKQAVGALTGAGTGANQMGKNLLLGEALVIWLNVPGTAMSMPRGELGFGSDQATVINIPKTIDSLFKIVEAQHPLCVPETAMFRRNNQGWLGLVNQAIAQINADSVDAAEQSAKTAMILSSATPFPHIVLANVSVKREKIMDAVMHLRNSIEEAKKDTLFASNIATALNQIGTLTLNSADSAKGANKDSLLTIAQGAFEELQALGGSSASFAQQQLIKVAVSRGDTVAIKAFYADQIANSSKYTFSQLVQSGAGAALANREADAVKLFEAALAQAPHHRDALFNLARLHIVARKDGAAALPLLERLVAVDPNGAENYQLMAFAYRELRAPLVAVMDSLAKQQAAIPATAANQARKKALLDSATKLDGRQRMFLDQLLLAIAKSDSLLPAKVSFSEYSPGATKAVVAGTIFNNTTAPKTYQFKLEFLDRSGAVVTTGEATVTAEPKKTGQFNITGNGANIVAFRYAPIT